MLSIQDGSDAYLRWIGESTSGAHVKSQAPNPKLQGTPKRQVPKTNLQPVGSSLGIWDLGVPWELGIWSLGVYSRACLRSAIRSSGSSIPAEIRTRLSVRPIAARRLRRHRRVRHRRRVPDERLDAAEALGERHQPDAVAAPGAPPRSCRRRTTACRRSRSSGASPARAAGGWAVPGRSPA